MQIVALLNGGTEHLVLLIHIFFNVAYIFTLKYKQTI